MLLTAAEVSTHLAEKSADELRELLVVTDPDSRPASGPIRQLARVAWTHSHQNEKRIGFTNELLALPDDTDLYVIAEPTEQPRDIKTIKADIERARVHLQQLEKEHAAAQLRKFLKKHGIPEGAEPILQDAAGTRFLVTAPQRYVRYRSPIQKRWDAREHTSTSIQ